MSRQPRVLLGSRTLAALQGIRKHLERQGFDVKIENQVARILTIAKRWPPDVVLLDSSLPPQTLGELCRIFRQSDQTHHIPILVAVSGSRNRLTALAAGADDFLSKPVNRQELETRIRSLIRIKRLSDELRRKVSHAERKAQVDGLTGLFNHSAFQERLGHEIARGKRYPRPCSVLMIDLDSFKNYNDVHGHPAGDRLLRRSGRLLKQHIREVDTGARYGGDEFAVILPETPSTSAFEVGERLRQLFEAKERVTVSVGVATFPDDAETPGQLVSRADRALYLAKARGRNCVCCSEGSLTAEATARPEIR